MAKILVIEDEPRIRENILELLSIEGFETLEAGDGAQGVALARQHQPDLVLCDVMMPEMDGPSVLRALRSEMGTATLPFIFLTALSSHDDFRAGMNLGADDYLTKPFKSTDLLRAVKSRLERHSSMAKAQQQALETLRQNLSRYIPHEMRTPLVGVLGFSQLLLDGGWQTYEPEAVEEMLKDIYQSGKRLERLVENHHYLGWVEEAERSPDAREELRMAAPGRVDAVVEQVASSLGAKYGRAGEVIVRVVQGFIGMEEVHLAKICYELVDNALKFSEAGTLVQVIGEAGPLGYRLTIADEGRGMSAEQMRRLGPFQQFDRDQYEQQGLGLGLHVASRLVRLYGGQVHATSAPMRGLCVVVDLPSHGDPEMR